MTDIILRQRIERTIVRQIVTDLLAAGYLITVDDGADNADDYPIKRSGDASAIMGALFTVDSERLMVFNPYLQKTDSVGWLCLIYGNDGWDVVNDYSTSLESVIGDGTETDRLCQLCEEFVRARSPVALTCALEDQSALHLMLELRLLNESALALVAKLPTATVPGLRESLEAQQRNWGAILKPPSTD